MPVQPRTAASKSWTRYCCHPDRADLHYEFYGHRGEVENRLKELNNDLELGRTSCNSFLANQLRG